MISHIIFLDIDGVMIAYPEDGAGNLVFTPRCVAAFKSVLAAVPSAKVVFSTTWRLPNYVNRLHQQWLEHGFPLTLAMDGTPDLRNDPSVLRRHSRGLEIRRWLKANPCATRWVVIDDDRMAIEEVLDNGRCVFTDPTRGMTVFDAEKAVAILVNAPQNLEKFARQVATFRESARALSQKDVSNGSGESSVSRDFEVP